MVSTAILKPVEFLRGKTPLEARSALLGASYRPGEAPASEGENGLSSAE